METSFFSKICKDHNLLQDSYRQYFTKKTNKLEVQYIKNKDNVCIYPLKTFAVFLSDACPILCILNITLETYKYKKFQSISETNFQFIYPKKGKIVELEPDVFFSFIDNDISENYDDVLFCNVWDNNNIEWIIEKNQENHLLSEIKEPCYKVTKNVIYQDTNMVNATFLHDLFYKPQQQQTSLKSIIEKYKIQNDCIIYFNDIPLRNDQFLKEATQKYGSIINSIYELEIDKKLPSGFEPKIDYYSGILNDKNKLWLIEEIKKYYTHYINKQLSVKNINYIFNFFIYNIKDLLIEKIKKIYNIYENTIIDIDSCFFSFGNLTINKLNNPFLTCVFLLNCEGILFSIDDDNNNNNNNNNNNKIELKLNDLLIVCPFKEYAIELKNADEDFLLVCNLKYIIE
jgi:hypothetical protein